VADLARRGEVRARDLQKLAKAVLDRADQSRTELTRLIQKEITRQVKALGLATRDEVDTLKKRVAKLEKPAKPRSAPKKS
jgi:polyhydroxyalkanoate synthesis regulator phasin